ncbi:MULTISPECIES: helix-turn-helix domain-containing protein [unclassified Variovorax]|uniref:helix-turn-helix domain-containing protein n=1 Tax=unclassified Variovorax TaxID=663243 RepID=UPI0008ABD3CD|nr:MULTISPECIES: helix-turn-helix domain-containing protein [unclassified Variovorax]SEK16054.1 AraC-type DNA-binding protein [Variovorax sp. OK202]SFE30672.1 AraC-type DNA-binding protein [Variovorax sp. OK212]
MTPTPTTLLDAALRGVLLALLLVLALVLGRDRPRLAAARAGALLALGLCVQVIGATPLFEALVPRGWQAPFVAVSVGNAVLFWVFVQALFDDDFMLRPLHVAAWVAVAVVAALNCAVVAGSASVLAPVTLGVQRAVPLVFAVLAAMAAASQWRADLVEGRRRLRVFIVVTGVGYSVGMLLVRLASPHGQLSDLSATADAAMLLLIVAVVAWRMLRLAGSELFPAAQAPVAMPAMPAMAVVAVVAADAPLEEEKLEEESTAAPAPAEAPQPAPEPQPQPQPKPEPEPEPAPRPESEQAPAPAPAEDRLTESLRHAMAVERVYRSEDLSIASLAARLCVPEYRLRRVINQRLGHRNFNAFVNGFRLAEAMAALADPSKRELPVLTVALTAGFQSIGPFNRAFKAATGLTPTEFRKEKLAES